MSRLASVLLCLLLPATVAAAALPVIAHDARVVLDAEAHTVAVVDEVTLPVGLTVLKVGVDLEIAAPEAPVRLVEDGGDSWQEIDLVAAGYTAGETVTFELRGVFHQPTSGVSFSRENVGGEINATVGPEGVYLSAGAGWLPWHEDFMATHRLEVHAPEGFVSVTQGRPEPGLESHVTTWIAEYPSDGLNLIAGRFFVHTEEVREGVTAMTFLLEDDARLRATYLERTKVYIDMYEEMIGLYPYAKFATVENWFPTGYGMPSYTLLGGQVLRLPFIPYTSFGHEICHNWWGNSVFVDISRGNWCEGLTSYCADYHYKELESPAAAREYRRNLLKDYHAYVGDPDMDFPLREFESRHSGATRAVGYGKSMMVFHMLEQRVGHEAFLSGMRQVAADFRFARASWDDFLAAFAAAGGDPLTGFAEQWLDRAGAPALVLADVEFTGDEVRFTLRQEGPAYDLQVPVLVTDMDGEQHHVVELAQAEQRFVLSGAGPWRLAVDPDYDIFRRLDAREVEPTVSQVLAAEAPRVVCGAAEREAGAAFGAAWTGDGEFTVTEDAAAAVAPGGAAVANLVLNPGREAAPAWRRPEVTVAGRTLVLDGARYDLSRYDLVYAVANPADPAVTDLVVVSSEPARLAGLARRLGHYGKYSWLLLPTGQGRVLRGNWAPAGSPLVAEAPTR